MTAPGRRPPGRTRETTLGLVGVGLAVVFVVAAVASLAGGDGGTWSLVRLAVALGYAAYAAWFLLRARRRDRAARPPGG